MKHSRIVPAGIVALALGAAFAPAAQSGDRHKDHAARIEQRMEEAAQRLGLTAEQKQQLRPIVDEHVAKAKALHESAPADASREQKRQMMHAAREDYDAKVRAVLDEKQRAEWDRMRAERRDRMREHKQERRHDHEAT